MTVKLQTMSYLDENQMAIAIFDVHASHRFNESLHAISKENFIEFVYVPACCTSELQPLDSDGGPNFQLKKLLKHEFSLWYSEQLLSSFQLSETEAPNISLNISIMKPLNAMWFEKSF